MPTGRDYSAAPGAGSLNVAVAAGILLHGFTREQLADESPS